MQLRVIYIYLFAWPLLRVSHKRQCLTKTWWSNTLFPFYFESFPTLYCHVYVLLLTSQTRRKLIVV